MDSSAFLCLRSFSCSSLLSLCACLRSSTKCWVVAFFQRAHISNTSQIYTHCALHFISARRLFKFHWNFITSWTDDDDVCILGKHAMWRLTSSARITMNFKNCTQVPVGCLPTLFTWYGATGCSSLCNHIFVRLNAFFHYFHLLSSLHSSKRTRRLVQRTLFCQHWKLYMPKALSGEFHIRWHRHHHSKQEAIISKNLIWRNRKNFAWVKVVHVLCYISLIKSKRNFAGCYFFLLPTVLLGRLLRSVFRIGFFPILLWPRFAGSFIYTFVVFNRNSSFSTFF